MERDIIWRFLLVCFLLTISTHCKMTVKPQNTLVRIEETVVLKCCSDDQNFTHEWKKYTDGLSNRIAYCPNGDCQDSGYLIDKTDPACSNLVVVYASDRQAGLYHCMQGGTHDKAGAYLNVFSLNCGANYSNKEDLVEGDEVLFKCRITWKGGSHFVVYWKDDEGNILQRSDFTRPQDTYVSTLSVRLQRPELRRYTVALKFLVDSATKKNEEIDMSSPNITWNSSKESVVYPVCAIQTSCEKDRCKRKIGDSILCSALGHPSPSFRWYDDDGEVVSDGSNLRLISTGEQRYKCVATNTIREKLSTQSRLIKVTVESVEITKPVEFQIQESLLYKLVTVAVILMILFLIFHIVKEANSCLRIMKMKFLEVYHQIKNRLNRRANQPTQDSQNPDIPETVPLQTQASNEDGCHSGGDGDYDHKVVTLHSKQDNPISVKEKPTDNGETSCTVAQPAD